MNIKVDGLDIYYEYYNSAGEGLPHIFLLHGWGCNVEVYTSILKLMAEKYSIIALDLPGFGKSDEPGGPWTVDNYADFVLHFLTNFTFDKLILTGHSMGGRIIIKLLTERKLAFEVPKIIMIDTAGIKPKKSFKAKVRQRIFKAGKFFYSMGFVKKLSPDALERWKKRFGSADYNSASPVMRQTLVRLVNEDQTDKLSQIHAPALLIWGENDTATPLCDGQLMEKLMPDAGLVTLKGAGHYSFLDQPFIFERVIRSFLDI